jgi:hypothetical protein
MLIKVRFHRYAIVLFQDCFSLFDCYILRQADCVYIIDYRIIMAIHINTALPYSSWLGFFTTLISTSIKTDGLGAVL